MDRYSQICHRLKEIKIPFFSIMTPSAGRSRTTIAKTESKSLFYATTMDGKRYSVKLKPFIKCHFCKLLFDTKNKRTGHERAWHTKK